MIELPASNRQLRALARLAENKEGWNTVKSSTTIDNDGRHRHWLSVDVPTNSLMKKPRKDKDES